MTKKRCVASKASPSRKKAPAKAKPKKTNSDDFKDIFWDISEELLCVIDDQGCFVQVNPAWVKTLGYQTSEIIGRPFTDFIHAEDIEPSIKAFSEKNEKNQPNKPHYVQNRYRTKDGKYRHIEWHGFVKNNLAYGVGKDVTEVRNQNFFLEQSNRTAKIGCWSVDLVDNTLWWNEETYRIHKIPFGQEQTVESAINHYIPEHRPIIQKAVEHAIQSGSDWNLELQILDSNQEKIWVSASGHTIKDENGEVIALAGTFQDIDLQKKIQFDLKEANERFELALEGNRDGIWDWEIPKNKIYFSHKFRTELGYKMSEFPESMEEFKNLIHEEDREEFKINLNSHLCEKEPFEMHLRIKSKKEQYLWHVLKGQALWNENDKPVRMAGSLSNIHERKTSQDSLAKQNQLLKVVLESMEEGVIIANNKAEFQLWNSQAENIVGLGTTDKQPEDWIKHYGVFKEDGKTEFKTEFKTEELPIMKAINGETSREIEMIIKNDIHPSGVLLSVSAEPLKHKNEIIGAVLVLRDITESRRVQDELEKQKAKSIESSKMAALGEMAGGMAHEINNPMMIIHGFAGRILKTIEQSEPNLEQIKEFGEKIKKTTNRVTKIVKGLKTFARDGSLDDPKPEKIEEIINETLDFCFERFKSHGVALELPTRHLDTEITCRKVEISQVLLNLLNNAFDALQEQKEKKVCITLNKNENFLEVTVSDNGPGIPKEIQERILQPFFTTKEAGKGTGLGLSICQGIVGRHKGSFSLHSDTNGTQFVFTLPVTQANELTPSNDTTKAA